MSQSPPPGEPEQNPFHIESSREVYDNRWIRVTEHRFTTRSGRPGIYGVVRFKHRAVGVIPYEDGHVWLVGQYRFPLARYSWEIPEGGCPEGEATEEAARRELAEETGMTAERLERIIELHLSNSVTDEYAAVYLARGLHPGAPRPEDTEVLQVRRERLEDVYARVTSGEITDSMTVAGILKLMLMRAEGKL